MTRIYNLARLAGGLGAAAVGMETAAAAVN